MVPRGQRPDQTPVIIIEPHPEQRPSNDEEQQKLIAELQDLAARNPLTRRIEEIQIWPSSLPVDIRHNSKIFRERLADKIREK